jgi:ComF family protein
MATAGRDAPEARGPLDLKIGAAVRYDRVAGAGGPEQDDLFPPPAEPEPNHLPHAGAAIRTISGAWARATLRQGAALMRSAVGIVYPPSCIACQAATGEAQALCPACWGGIGFIERPYCERLGTPFAVDLGDGLVSPAAIVDPPVFARARAVCRFDGTARELVHKLKYGDRTDLALTLGRMMTQAGRELLLDAALIVPVPLHRTRLWSRRFNQAAALAQVVAGQSRVPLAALALARVKRTRQQVGLTRAQRAENLQGAFRVPASAKPQIEGRRILLVDDVLTTGSTANAAARALLRGGASAVDILTFARVVSDGS